MQNEVKPTQAIVIYEKTNGYGKYIEAIEIKERNNLFYLGNTFPVTEDYIISLNEILSKIIKSKISLQLGHVFDGLLFYRQEISTKVAWISKPKRASLNFTKELEIKNGFCKLPHLLWIVNDFKLNVYPVEKIGKTYKIYKSPFLNMYEYCVCWGNTDMKELKYIKTIEDYTDLIMDKFFESRFSHSGGETSTIGNAELFWKELMNEKKPELTTNHCIEMENKTLTNLIEEKCLT